MAVTETPPETVEAASAAATSAPRPQPTGLAAVLGSGDHKTVGRLYILSALVLGIGVLVLGLLFGVEAAQPDTWDVFSSAHGMQAFTLLRVGTVFFLAFPLVVGVALVVVPLQVGARTVAFPRAAAASYWGWLLGSILLIASYLADGGPFGTSDRGIDLWIAALGLVVVSLLVAAISLATTILALRTTGLTLERTPLYAWSVAVAAVLWLLTLPVLVGFLALMYVDHRHGAISFGSASAAYGVVGWIFRNPTIYVLAIPVLGFVADVVATSAGSRTKARGFAQGAIGVFGAVSFGAFLAVPSTKSIESYLMIGLALLAVVPVLAIGALAGDTVRRGAIKANPGVAYAAASLLALLLATLAGAIGTIPGVVEVPDGATASDNIFFLGVTHAVVLAAVIAALGGVTWWAVKVGRRAAARGPALLAPAILLVGTAVLVIPDLVSGITGKGVETAADPTGGVAGLNVVALVGLVVVALGLLVAAVSLLPLLKRSDDDADADPWGTGQTLEWLTASPPAPGNFDGDLPVVTSAEPLIDLREEK